jgi:hypothetical protein
MMLDMRYIFVAVKIQARVFWIMMLSSAAVGYQCFGGPCCLFLQGEGSGTGKGDKDIGVQ